LGGGGLPKWCFLAENARGLKIQDIKRLTAKFAKGIRKDKVGNNLKRFAEMWGFFYWKNDRVVVNFVLRAGRGD